jgi:NAD(P)-dependent dehydrogenase (short-subunit alcohol dehydrogenase family)
MATTIPRVVLITGANQGIGFHIAKVLSQSKTAYTILVGARDPARGSEAVSKLATTKTNPDTTISTIPVDLNDTKTIDSALGTISKDHGRLDVLINNAGRMGASVTPEDWHAIFQVNFFGTVRKARVQYDCLVSKSALSLNHELLLR